MFRILKRPNFWLVFLGDAVLAGLAYYLAYYLRFDGDISATSLTQWLNTVVWIVPLKLACFFFFGLYKGMWRSAPQLNTLEGNPVQRGRDYADFRRLEKREWGLRLV